MAPVANELLSPEACLASGVQNPHGRLQSHLETTLAPSADRGAGLCSLGQGNRAVGCSWHSRGMLPSQIPAARKHPSAEIVLHVPVCSKEVQRLPEVMDASARAVLVAASGCADTQPVPKHLPMSRKPVPSHAKQLLHSRCSSAGMLSITAACGPSQDIYMMMVDCCRRSGHGA